MLRSTLKSCWRPYLALFAYVLLLARSFLGDHTVYWGDLVLYFEPMYRLIQANLAKGDIPLWNPEILCGQPLLGNPQMGVFFPWLLLLKWFAVWNVIRIGAIFHLWLSGVFSYHFLKRWTSGQLPALAGALVYAGSGCLLGRVQFPPMLFAAAYLPLLLLCCDIVIDSMGHRGRARLTMAVGLSLLAAHPHMTYLSLICTAAYSAARLYRLANRTFEIGAPIRLTRRVGGTLLSSLGLGVCLAAVQLLPSLQVMMESSREQLTPGQANRFYLDAVHLLTIIWPHFLGHPATSDYWGVGNVWEPAIFIGWLPLVLIGYAARQVRTNATTRFWLAFMAVSLWLALGTDAGLYWVAFYLLPGLSKFHDPARFLVLFTFGAAVLTAIGFDMLLRDRRFSLPASGVIYLTCVAAPLVWAAAEWLPTASIRDLSKTPRILEQTKFDATEGRTYLPSHEVFSRNYISAGYTDYGDNSTRGIGAMIDTLMPNLNMRYGIQSASGYEPVPLRGAAAIDGLARVAYRRGEPNFLRLTSLMAVTQLVLPGTVRYAIPLSGSIPVDQGLSQSNNHYRTLKVEPIKPIVPVCQLVSRVRHVDGEMRISAYLTAPEFDPQAEALISDAILSDEPDLDTIRRPEPVRCNVTVVTSSASRLELEAFSADRPSFLVVSIAAFPGWHALIDHVPVHVHRVDGGIMGVFVPAGTHLIRLEYRPDCYRVGLYVTLVAVILLCIQLVLGHSRRSRLG
jgi:hypothetical protein